MLTLVCGVWVNLVSICLSFQFFISTFSVGKFKVKDRGGGGEGGYIFQEV